MAPLVGIFVGGAARRLGGAPKGLLESPLGGKLIVRLASVAREAIADCEVVLIGRNSAYDALGLSSLDDEPPGIGPIGGLAALLGAAAARAAPFAIAIACDLPFISADLLRKLAEHPSPAAAVAPRLDGLWQPLVARYRPAPALGAARAAIAAGERALHRVLARLGDDAVVFELSPTEIDELRDWDEPGDLG